MAVSTHSFIVFSRIWTFERSVPRSDIEMDVMVDIHARDVAVVNHALAESRAPLSCVTSDGRVSASGPEAKAQFSKMAIARQGQQSRRIAMCSQQISDTGRQSSAIRTSGSPARATDATH
jgi:hypothetical protein